MEKENKMIESDGMSLEMWKSGNGILKTLILAWLILVPILWIAFGNFSWNLIKTYFLVLAIYLIFRKMSQRIKFNLYSAKIDENSIILKKDINSSIDFNWDEIDAVSRLRFTNPSLYIMTPKKSDNTVFIFPSSGHWSTAGISINGFGINWDFSKMGKLIRQLKKDKNLKSVYPILLFKGYSELKSLIIK